MEKARILIVEDEELVALSIKTFLESIGHSVPLIVPTGEEAIKRVGAEEPDVVLMDIRLGGVMDGIQAARIIKESYHLPVIYLTAYSDVATLESARITEPFGYILKPFDERTLQAVIEMTLYKAQMQREIQRTREKLASILNSLGDGIVVTGINGIIEYANPKALSMLGYTDHVPPQTQVFQILKILDEKSGEPKTLFIDEVVIQGKPSLISDCVLIVQGSQGPRVELRIEPHRDERGTIRGMVMSFRDLAQRFELESLAAAAEEP